VSDKLRQLEDYIAERCEEAGCKPKVAALHRDQYVNRRWDPHPPQDFVRWWHSQPESRLKAVIAYNCAEVRKRWEESKASYGLR